MVNETRKIMGIPDLRFTATCVRVPVLRAHSEAVNVEFHEPFSVEEARSLLASALVLSYSTIPPTTASPCPPM